MNFLERTMTTTIQIVINLIHKVILKSINAVKNHFIQISLKGYLHRNHVQFSKDLRILGWVKFIIPKESQVQIGKAFICRGRGYGIEPGLPSLISVNKGAKLIIGDYVFIGTRSIICKGVTIGNHSIIAAGSVIVKDIPSDEVWGGNPARFIRKVYN